MRGSKSPFPRCRQGGRGLWSLWAGQNLGPAPPLFPTPMPDRVPLARLTRLASYRNENDENNHRDNGELTHLACSRSGRPKRARPPTEDHRSITPHSPSRAARALLWTRWSRRRDLHHRFDVFEIERCGALRCGTVLLDEGRQRKGPVMREVEGDDDRKGDERNLS